MAHGATKLALVVVVALVMAGCGGDAREGAPRATAQAEPTQAPGAAPTRDPGMPAAQPAGAVLDERAGTFRGVGIGSPRRAFERRFGRGRHGPVGVFAPLGEDAEDLGAPPRLRNPPGTGPASSWRFRGVAAIADRGRAWAVVVSELGARTRRGGVRIGDPLSIVPVRHRSARCDVASEGPDSPRFPYCTVRLRRDRHLWFGEDPIRSFAVSRGSFRG